MLYKEYLANLDECPFCNDSEREILSADNAYLTYARAPYHKHHLLVIPREHKTSLFDLSTKEKDEIDELINEGMILIKKLGYEDFTVIVREGDNAAKSISHLHYHIIPNVRIGDLDHQNRLRKILSDDALEKLLSEIRAAQS